MSDSFLKLLPLLLLLSSIIGGIIVVIFNWIFGERSRVKWQSYLMREKKYSRMLKNIWGFYKKTLLRSLFKNKKKTLLTKSIPSGFMLRMMSTEKQNHF